MDELRTRETISWLDDVDSAGVVVNPRHELYGKCLAGTTLRIPGASGSTVGSDRIVNLAFRGLAPRKIVLDRIDPITMWGAIFGKIEVEVPGVRRVTVDPRALERRGVEPEVAEYLARAGELLGTDEFIPVDYVQIAGVSYKTITETGLELRRYFGSQYRFRAPHVTINPAGMDLRDWKALGIPEEFARKQQEVIELYVRMGARPTVTCTPYLIGSMPPAFTDAFLSESSVVAYANSVLAVRTNRESGLSSLLYAIAGWGPRYGLHLPENRQPTLRVRVTGEVRGTVDFGLLGYRLGEIARGRVPYLTGIPSPPTLEELKVLSAAGAASGSVDLYHIEGVTAEAEGGLVSLGGILETVEIDRADLERVRGALNTGRPEDLDLVTFGCPHASLVEVEEIAQLLEGKQVRPGVALWVCTSRAVKELAARQGLVDTIERAGGRVVADTCMVVAPIESMGPKTTATNSGKAAKYLPRFCGQKVVFGSAAEILGRISEDAAPPGVPGAGRRRAETPSA